MSSNINHHKLKQFVRQLCIAAKRLEEDASVQPVMSKQDVLRQIDDMKATLNELGRREHGLFRNTRQGEFIIAELRRRVEELENRVTKDEFETNKLLTEDHDKIVFLTQAMDNLKDRLALLGNLREKDLRHERHFMNSEKHDVSEMKSKIETMERRYNEMKSSMDKKTAEKISRKLQSMKKKLR